MKAHPVALRRVRGALLPLALLLAAHRASAHELWIVPGKYRLAPSEATRVFINNGDVYPGSLTLLSQHRLSGVTVHSPGETAPVVEFRVDGKSLTFDLRPEQAGIHVLALSTRPRRVRMSAADFSDYLAEEGLKPMSALRSELGEEVEAAVERYSKYAKAVVDVGGEGATESRLFAEPVGHPLEIVPLDHPNEVTPGGRLRVRVLFQGEPLAGATLTGGRASGAPREIAVTTQEGGEAEALVSSPGRWFLRALHMIRLEDDPEVRWESYWCTLSFEVAERKPR